MEDFSLKIVSESRLLTFSKKEIRRVQGLVHAEN